MVIRSWVCLKRKSKNCHCFCAVNVITLMWTTIWWNNLYHHSHAEMRRNKDHARYLLKWMHSEFEKISWIFNDWFVRIQSAHLNFLIEKFGVLFDPAPYENMRLWHIHFNCASHETYFIFFCCSCWHTQHQMQIWVYVSKIWSICFNLKAYLPCRKCLITSIESSRLILEFLQHFLK